MHVETRQNNDQEMFMGSVEETKDTQVIMDMLLTVELVKERIIKLVQQIKNSKHVHSVSLVECRQATSQGEQIISH